MIFIDDYCEALRREKETALELQTEALVTLETMVVGDGIVSCPYLPLYILFQDVSRCFKFPFHISPNETVQWIQRIERGRFVGSCSGVCTFWILLTFLTRWLVAYALATPGVSWAMGATAECFRLSWGRSGTWPASNASNVFYIVLLFLVISRYFLFILTYFDLLILLGYYGILKSELKLEGVSNRFGIPPSGFQIQEE